MICVVDACVLIDHLRGVVAAREVLDRYRERRVSALTVTELERVCMRLYGQGPGYRSEVLDALLTACVIVPVDLRIARTAASLAAATGLPLWDAIVVATARVDGVRLLTRRDRYAVPEAVIAYEAEEPILERMIRSIREA